MQIDGQRALAGRRRQRSAAGCRHKDARGELLGSTVCVLSGGDLVAPTRVAQAQGWQGRVRRVSGARWKSGERVTGLMSSACDVTTVFFGGALPVIAELLQSVCQPGTLYSIIKQIY